MGKFAQYVTYLKPPFPKLQGILNAILPHISTYSGFKLPDILYHRKKYQGSIYYCQYTRPTNTEQ